LVIPNQLKAISSRFATYPFLHHHPVFSRCYSYGIIAISSLKPWVTQNHHLYTTQFPKIQTLISPSCEQLRGRGKHQRLKEIYLMAPIVARERASQRVSWRWSSPGPPGLCCYQRGPMVTQFLHIRVQDCASICTISSESARGTSLMLCLRAKNLGKLWHARRELVLVE
jgi:hypothetical protein